MHIWRDVGECLFRPGYHPEEQTRERVKLLGGVWTDRAEEAPATPPDDSMTDGVSAGDTAAIVVVSQLVKAPGTPDRTVQDAFAMSYRFADTIPPAVSRYHLSWKYMPRDMDRASFWFGSGRKETGWVDPNRDLERTDVLRINSERIVTYHMKFDRDGNVVDG